jgi:HD-like signal output (HDOD) protein
MRSQTALEAEPTAQPASGVQRSALGDLVAKSLELPTVPAIAAAVIRALEDPNVGARDIAKVIQTDQGITARLIKTCNSSVYGLQREVSSLQSAIALLGFIEVRDLVLASSTRYLYRRFGVIERNIWQHSVAMASCARMLALALAPEAKDAAYLAGQMHDVGKVVMNNAEPRRFALAAAQPGSSWEAEQAAFGFSHADVGSLLSVRWKMPAPIEAAIFYHHDFAMGRSFAPEHIRLIACVILANGICHRVGFGADASASPLRGDEREALTVLGASEKQLEILGADFEKKFRAEMAG